VSIAVDTNVLVRYLVRDDDRQYKAARRLVDQASVEGEPIFILLVAIMETEWVLRSFYKLDKASIAQAFAQLLETRDVVVEEPATLEEALYVWAQHPAAEFADCLLTARSAQAGRSRFLTSDVRASKLPGAQWLV